MPGTSEVCGTFFFYITIMIIIFIISSYNHPVKDKNRYTYFAHEEMESRRISVTSPQSQSWP